MKSIKVLTAVLFSALFMIPAGCGKYEDGPWFSIYSRDERITGYWRFAGVRIDGEDKTDEYAEQSVEILRNGQISWTQGYHNDNPYDRYGVGGTWQFKNSDKNLEMSFTEGTTDDFTWLWNITRLAYGDLRINRYDDQGRKIEWRLWSR